VVLFRAAGEVVCGESLKRIEEIERSLRKQPVEDARKLALIHAELGDRARHSVTDDAVCREPQ
jgi:hypothetical protein